MEKVETYFCDHMPTMEDIRPFKEQKGVVLIKWYGMLKNGTITGGDILIQDGKFMSYAGKLATFKIE